MSTEIGGRPVLRPAGNIALRHEGGDGRPALRKATKPPPSPVKPPAIPVAKISPPNSQPSTPKTTVPQSRSPVLKPAAFNSPCKLPPSPPSRKPLIATSPSKSCSQSDTPALSSAPKIRPSSTSIGCAQQTIVSAIADVVCSPKDATTDTESISPVDPANSARKPGTASAREPASKSCPPSPSAQNRKINPHISLTKSSADVFQKATSNAKAKPRRNLSKFGSLSLDETSLANIVAAKKALAIELHAQKKLKMAEYGRKQGKASRVAPDVTALPPISVELKRCKFITAQSDPVYVAYHDEEWGVPVHDDRMLFELLMLAGAQVELSWPTILRKRDAYRDAFAGFDPAAVARFNEKHIRSLEADRSLMLQGVKIRGVVENAQRVLEIVEEFGSLDSYLWGFLNNHPMVNNYRYPKQVPVKTSKSECISKDLVRRGFRFVGPTIMYSFMQAAGMTNDHLVQCFRHHECEILSSPQEVNQEQQQDIFRLHECEILSSPQELDQEQQQEQHHHQQQQQQQQQQLQQLLLPEACTYSTDQEDAESSCDDDEM